VSLTCKACPAFSWVPIFVDPFSWVHFRGSQFSWVSIFVGHFSWVNFRGSIFVGQLSWVNFLWPIFVDVTNLCRCEKESNVLPI